ncbi:MAG: CapA family protein [Clostridia bacterium]|nr:CapA family protein [Clostridia bacterium]
MKKLLPLFLTLILLACAAGCDLRPDRLVAIDPPDMPVTAVPSATPEGWTTPEPAETDEVVTTPTPAPTPEVYVPASVEEAISVYEATPLDYESVTREAEQPIEPIPEPRYTMGADGIYRSSESANDNQAIIMLTGDLMCQTRQQEVAKTSRGYSFNGSFAYVKDIFATADLVVGNLEATLCESAPYMAELIEVEGRPHLNAPATFLEALRYAGYDMVVMSNNHNIDTGVRGIYDTLDRVDEYRLIHTGLFRNEAECRYTVVNVDGINIGFMSYATYFNHKEEHLTSEGVRVLLNPYSKEIVARDVAAVKAAGAEYVIVYIHWGVEYMNEPEEQQYIWAQELADAGVDYIIGSHPHALQPYDILTAADGRQVPIVYSMGNFVSHQEKVVTKDTLILRIVIEKTEDGRVYLANEGYISCRVFKTFFGKDYAVVPVVTPYNGGIYSQYFGPAYDRITQIMGDKIAALGSL